MDWDANAFKKPVEPIGCYDLGQSKKEGGAGQKQVICI